LAGVGHPGINTFIEVPTIARKARWRKEYGSERCRNQTTTSRLPDADRLTRDPTPFPVRRG